MDNAFLIHTSEVLADTDTGLTGAQIVNYCNNYSLDFNVIIPVNSSDFGKFGSRVPNKRTALLQNLQAFSDKQQFQIIKELADLEFFADNESVKKLRVPLYTRYGFFSGRKLSNTELVVKTKHWL